MKLFLGIFGFVFIVSMCYLLYTMITTEPSYSNGKSKFSRNLKEGGKMAFYIFTLASFLVSLALYYIISVFQVLENLKG